MLIPLTVAFLAVDLTFFAANVSKIGHGAWFPLVVGGVVFVIMTTWKRGRDVLGTKYYADSPPLEEFVAEHVASGTLRVPGKAVFMAATSTVVPPALLRNTRYNKVLHHQVAVLTIRTLEIPRVTRGKNVEVEELGSGFWRVTADYGFMDHPDVPEVLALAREQGLGIDLNEATFFLGREHIVRDRHPVMPLWREAVFAFLSSNAQGPAAFFRIPPQQVVEIGTQLEL
jgi:KUP system potassium uptake protein